MPGRIVVEKEGPVAILRIENPPANLLTLSMVSEFAPSVAALEADDSVRAVLVAGSGDSPFCGGIDLAEWSRLSPKAAQEAVTWGQDAFWALEHITKPTIAAVSGTCRGAGADLALACDVRIAAEGAVFSYPEVEVGWMPAHGGTARLARILGRSRALEILLTAKPVKALDALRLGLVDHLTPPGDVIPRAKQLAELFASKPRSAVKAIKRTIVEGEEKPYRNRFLLESQHAVQLLWSPEYKAAIEKGARKRK